MRKTSLAVLCAVVIAALTLTAYAAAAKSYQFTGVVKTVDAGTFTVQKSASETWEFRTHASTKGTPKVGDKVTVQDPDHRDEHRLEGRRNGNDQAVTFIDGQTCRSGCQEEVGRTALLGAQRGEWIDASRAAGRNVPGQPRDRGECGKPHERQRIESPDSEQE